MSIRRLTGRHSVTKGKVVLVSFPFDDLSSSKVRPAVCLTHPLGIHRHVILAFITSRMPEDLLETDLVIEPGSADFHKTGLRVASVLRLHRLLTVSTSVISRELGVLSPGLKAEVRGGLRRLFEI
ncbi:MAG: type II toxin-antitoxin system PemK/MazF family toxin [Deltaproteobacteria bacterium]|nr:type II toxin-antitoxin system PemK/MazF family toxin [Deltaproteobacteria bacterium]